jgi:antitoxin ParD1/3/4
MMTSINISLPEPLKKFIQAEAKRGGYSTPSEYVRQLVREAQARQRETINQNLLKALESGPATPMTASDWTEIRRRVFGGKRTSKRAR